MQHSDYKVVIPPPICANTPTSTTRNVTERTSLLRWYIILLIIVASTLVIDSICHLVGDTHQQEWVEYHFDTPNYSYGSSFDGITTDFNSLASQAVSQTPIKKFYTASTHPSQESRVYSKYTFQEPAFTSFGTTGSLSTSELIEKFNSSAETGKSIRAVATPKILSHSNRGVESSIATNHRVMASVVYEPFNAYSPSQLYDQSIGDIGGGMSSLNTRQNAFPGMETDPGVRDPESPIGEPYILIVFAIVAIIYTSKNRKSIIQ